jgi:uncharacterized protein (TIGR02453 family)
MAFTGFPAEAFEFYERLGADNTRSFWAEHRDEYESLVKEPMEALAADLGEEFGRFRLFRPHRDVRFSADKTPYKTQQGAATEGEGGETYYVHLSAEGLYAAAGYYMMAKDQLERYRAAVAADHWGDELVHAVAAVKRAELEPIGPALKSAPRGFPRDHPRIDLLRCKGLAMGRQWAPARWMSTPKALSRIVQVWRTAQPVNDWLNAHVGPSELPPEERRH